VQSDGQHKDKHMSLVIRNGRLYDPRMLSPHSETCPLLTSGDSDVDCENDSDDLDWTKYNDQDESSESLGCIGLSAMSGHSFES
jgi:hypothetical protein